MSTSTDRRYIAPKETAAFVRKALKAAFPGVKFSVRTDTYSGGASVDVTWIDGPFERDVERTAKRYAMATFDGMTDMKTDHSLVLPGEDGSMEEVFGGADYVFCTRTLSPGYVEQLAGEAAKVVEANACSYQQGWALDTWYETLGCDHGCFPSGNGHMLVRYLSQYVAPEGV